ncbi:MAG: LPS export ABC transporter permease LptG [Deltaproteobacteria bacterium]|nr:LPS export ABC transporter permease LptG [Deltaproteobacteria bacterium]MBI3077293.1 LPS export ABC transporter permease LptG [Deltaproteobacteria bacterium]
MGTLTRYLLREMLRVWALALAAFTLLYLVVDILDRMHLFIRHQATTEATVRYFALKLPLMVSQVLPVAVLLATLLSLLSLSLHNEVTAMRASGISMVRITAPFLGAALALAGAGFLLNEYVVPQTQARVQEIMRVEVERKPPVTTLTQNRIWYRGREGIYYFQAFDPRLEQLSGVSLYLLTPEFRLRARIDARRARWTGGGWLFQQGVTRELGPGGLVRAEPFTERRVALPETPESFRGVRREATEMGFRELRQYVARARDEGYDPTPYAVEMHARLSLPFASVLMALLAIPFTLRNPRAGGVAMAIGLSLALTFLYWLVLSLGLSLGKAGMLPPVLAAWLGNLLFAAAGGIILRQPE